MKKVRVALLATALVASSIVVAPQAQAAVTCVKAKATVHKPSAPKQPTKVAAKLASTFTFTTNCGDIVVQTLGKKAPVTVTAIQTLINAKYYDGTYCHRVVTAGIYVLQCGDPTATGSGGPVGWKGYIDENVPPVSDVNYPAGTVAMANAGPKTNGSQFFLVYKDSHLDPSAYTIWGKITKGIDILTFIASKGAAVPNGNGQYVQGTDGLPIQEAAIIKATAK